MSLMYNLFGVNNMKVTLASTSEYKNNLLDIVKFNHYQIASDFEEVSSSRGNVYEYVKDLALGKAKSVEDKVVDGIILGLDTVVYACGKILEKPKTLEEAKEYIAMCAGKTTEVITGIALINKENGVVIQDMCVTKVSLRKMSEEDISYYIANEPLALKVSGFVIETVMSNFIEKIDGSYYNILGVPVETIYKHIEQMGYTLKDLEKEIK